MAKNKLKKFEQLKTFENVFQPKLENINLKFNLKGNWNTTYFKNKNPIVLELGCGKGEYTISLAEKNKNKNFIGVDIKGARLWSGARLAKEKKLNNVAFLRTRIDFIERCFEKDEVNEIWITFPDPQIKKNRSKKRLTHPYFLSKYNTFLKDNSCIHLKTDSLFLHAYTIGVLENSNYKIHDSIIDLYSKIDKNKISEEMKIKTHYENLFLKKGKSITYLRFSIIQ